MKQLLSIYTHAKYLGHHLLPLDFIKLPSVLNPSPSRFEAIEIHTHTHTHTHILIGGKLLYNVVLVSAIQQCKSAIIIHISPPS